MGGAEKKNHQVEYANETQRSVEPQLYRKVSNFLGCPREETQAKGKKPDARPSQRREKPSRNRVGTSNVHGRYLKKGDTTTGGVRDPGENEQRIYGRLHH